MNAADVLIAPVVSEKSYAGLADRQYTFKVHKDAHKTQVRQAVEQLFGVKVKSVRIIKVAAKPKRRGVIKGVLELGFNPAEKITIFRIPGAWEADGIKILKKYGVEFCDRTVSISEAARRAVEKMRTSGR